MEQDPEHAVHGLEPDEFGQVVEHLDDPVPPPVKPGGPLRSLV